MQIVFIEIEKIEVEPYSGTVFNLQTDTEEYVTNGVVVHNCPHTWSTNPNKVPSSECANLWMGQ